MTPPHDTTMYVCRRWVTSSVPNMCVSTQLSLLPSTATIRVNGNGDGNGMEKQSVRHDARGSWSHHRTTVPRMHQIYTRQRKRERERDNLSIILSSSSDRDIRTVCSVKKQQRIQF